MCVAELGQLLVRQTVQKKNKNKSEFRDVSCRGGTEKGSASPKLLTPYPLLTRAAERQSGLTSALWAGRLTEREKTEKF